MKTVTWIACGIGLNIAAAALHGGSAPQAIMTTGLAGTLPKLLLVATGNICIWRGLRSAVGDLWGVAAGKSYRKPEARSRFGGDAELVLDFDADEALARYMEQRNARDEKPAPDSAPRPMAPRPSPRTPVPPQRGFGRKAV